MSLQSEKIESGPSSGNTSHSDLQPNPGATRQTPAAAPQAPPPVAPPPNGGLQAWLQVLGSFMLFFNSWGAVNAFGVYQTYYEKNFLEASGPSNISWIGSLQAFLLLLIGILTGPLFDAGFFRHLLAAGSFLLVFGMMMTSLAHTYYQVFLAQAVCVGLGSGCLFVPSVAIVSTYFTTKRSFATGIAAAGSSLGGLIYPIVFRELQPKIGFGWATRVIAFIILGTQLICLAVMRTRMPKPAKTRSLLDLAAFKDVAYTMFSIGEFFGFMGLYIPFFYIQGYAMEVAGLDENLAFYMLPILNAASVFGRLIPNFLADKTGPLNMLVPCSFISAILAFGWIGIKSTGGLIVFCILYGFFSGTFVSLPPTTIASLSPDMSVVGVRMGMSFTFAGFGLLVGTPIAGAIVKNSGFAGAAGFCAACVLVATFCMGIARVAKTGKNIMAKC